MKTLYRLFKWDKPPPAHRQLSSSVDPYDLDTSLLRLSPVDYWTMRDSCEGVLITGETGSGKTSGSGVTIAKAYLRAGFGGLVLCAKPEEVLLWHQYARETGREKSLIIFGPGHPWKFNFLNWELCRESKGGGQTENILNLLTHIVEIAENQVDSGGGEQFWNRAMREMLRNAIDLLSVAKGALTLEDIVKVIAEAPQNLEEVGPLLSPAVADAAGYEPTPQAIAWWNHSFCAECIDEAGRKQKTPVQMHDFATAFRYWTKTFPGLSDRTRSGIVATFTSIADMLLHGFAWELFCTTTNLSPEMTYKDGAIIVLDISVQEYHDLGRIMQGIFKFMFQRAILQRDVKQHPRPVFLWADEAQNFVSSFDFMAQAVARSARLCTVLLTQNVNNLYSVLGGGGRGENQAHALMGNLGTKIFHAQSDRATNHYAAEVIGQEWTTAMNFSASAAESSHNSQSSGGSQTVQYKILPEAFTRLRKGGPQNGLQVEGIVFQGGRVWNATGDTYLKVVFKQG